MAKLQILFEHLSDLSGIPARAHRLPSYKNQLLWPALNFHAL